MKNMFSYLKPEKVFNYSVSIMPRNILGGCLRHIKILELTFFLWGFGREVAAAVVVMVVVVTSVSLPLYQHGGLSSSQ
jgi:hypothetical protein